MPGCQSERLARVDPHAVRRLRAGDRRRYETTSVEGPDSRCVHIPPGTDLGKLVSPVWRISRETLPGRQPAAIHSCVAKKTRVDPMVAWDFPLSENPSIAGTLVLQR